MNSKLLLIGILATTIISCMEQKPLGIDYCEMLTRDQSYVDREETDTAKIRANKLKRHQIFVENYAQLIKLTKQEGFPKIKFGSTSQDSCKYWAVTATLIHIAQTRAELLFNEATISLLKEEMNKGNLKSGDLMAAFRISFTTEEFCDTLEPHIRKAIDVWGMARHLDGEPKFKKCK